jgi:hypothetical protein
MGRICRLQLLLALASASEFREIRDHFLLSQIRDSPNMEGQVPVFISPWNRVAQLYPQALGSFSSPPTTRRPTAEVFEPASTRGFALHSLSPISLSLLLSRVESNVTTDGQSASPSWNKAPTWGLRPHSY